MSIISHHNKVAMDPPPEKYTLHHITTDKKLTAVHKNHCSMQRFKVNIIAATDKTVVAPSMTGCRSPSLYKIHE